MLDDLVAAYGNRFVVAALGVILAMGCLILVLWVLKKRAGSAFIRGGGRSRLPRLQVLDATAVDARRRIVLIRRDNVEHLIMIGGPTDVVIESRIGEHESWNEVGEHAPQQAAALPRRPVAEAPVPLPDARAQKQRQPQAAPPQPVPAQRAINQQAPQPLPAQSQPAKPATRQPQPTAYQREEPMELDADEDDGNSFFYDEFYDETSEEDEIADLLEATRGRVFADPAATPVRAPQSPANETPRQNRDSAQAAPVPTFSPSDFERALEEEIALHMPTDEQIARAASRPAAPPPTRPTIAPPRPMAPPLMARAPEPRPPETRQPEPRPAEIRRPEARMPDPRQAAPAPTPVRPVAQPAARPAATPPTRPAAAQRPAAASARPAAQPNLQNEIARIFGEMSTKREK